MVSIGERVKARRLELALSQTALGKMIGPPVVTKAAVSQWEKNETTPTGPNLMSLARALRQSPEWVLGDKRPHKPIVIEIPVLSYAGAGEEVHTLQGDPDAPDTGWTIDGPAGLTNPAAVVVRGDSMAPVYREGDYLVFEQDGGPSPDLIGKDCIVRLADGRMFVKRLLKGSRKGRYTLASYNSATELIMDKAVQRASQIIWVKRG